MNSEAEERTKSCIRTLIEMIKIHGWDEDINRIFGVRVTKNNLNNDREGMIVYGPSTPEACQAFVLGLKEVVISLAPEGESFEPILVDCVNLKQLCRRVEYEDFLDDSKCIVAVKETEKEPLTN